MQLPAGSGPVARLNFRQTLCLRRHAFIINRCLELALSPPLTGALKMSVFVHCLDTYEEAVTLSHDSSI